MPNWFEQNAAALIGHGLTVVGLVVGAITVVCQLGRQHKNSIALQRENTREALKLRVFEILVKKTRNLSHAASEAGMYAFQIPIHLDIHEYQRSLGLFPIPLSERAPEFFRLHGEAGSALVELIEEFESWAIAFPGLDIFRTALIAASHDAREAFSTLHSALLRVLPMDLPIHANANPPGPIIQQSLSGQEHTELLSLATKYKDAMDEIACYVYDLTIEAQNNLLSGLFDHRVAPRKPLDPSCKVISTDPKKTQHLRRYFENETAWGRAKAMTESDVVARLATNKQV